MQSLTISLDLLQGEWRVKAPKKINQVDQHTNDAGWLHASVISDDEGVTLKVCQPAIHTLYYYAMKGRIVWGESKSYIVSKMSALGVHNPKIKQVAGGTQVRYTEGKAVVEQLIVSEPKKALDIELGNASIRTEAALLKATVEMADLNHKHLVCLSGGTDSLITAAMLQEVGVKDLVAVSVGADDTAFDVVYAKEYAKQLNLRFVFLQIPEDPVTLKKLLTDTIRDYEGCDLSNTYMGLCNTMIRRYAEENGIQAIWQGYYADRLLGHSLTMKSNFLKRVANKPTEQDWVDYRWGLYGNVTPNDEQVAKTLRNGSTYWRTPFLHKAVREFVTRLTSDSIPWGYKDGKPLFELIADRFVEGGSWHVGKKKGYYSGAGVGDLGRKHEFMSEDGMKKIHKQIKILG